MQTNSIPYLEQALKINDALIGMPAIPLVIVGCLMCGYFLKAMPFFRNQYIPLGVYCFGIALMLGITPLSDKVIVGRSIIYGLAAAWIAIMFHRRVLSRFDDDKPTHEKPQNPPA